EQEGTYPLPEAQLDRFTLQISVDYPAADAEREIVALGTRTPPILEPVLEPAELLEHQALVKRIPVPDSVIDHVVALLRATRPGEASCPAGARELLQWGAGPRAGQQLVAAAQARAALSGAAAVSIADVRDLAGPALEHRVVPSFAAQNRGIGGAEIMTRILEAVPA
ncbi:MAG: MoxR family ATPase, partial [Myxococcales bacterium]|nr:MoxR family ATPase [Myxococcales bacterium]